MFVSIRLNMKSSVVLDLEKRKTQTLKEEFSVAASPADQVLK